MTRNKFCQMGQILAKITLFGIYVSNYPFVSSVICDHNQISFHQVALCHMTDKLMEIPLIQNILFCDVKTIQIIVTQMGVKNLGINSVFVLFTSDKSISIDNVSTYHKECEDSAYLHLMCTQRPCIHEIQHFATQVKSSIYKYL